MHIYLIVGLITSDSFLQSFSNIIKYYVTLKRYTIGNELSFCIIKRKSKFCIMLNPTLFQLCLYVKWVTNCERIIGFLSRSW